jgi:hypothetical protein
LRRLASAPAAVVAGMTAPVGMTHPVIAWVIDAWVPHAAVRAPPRPAGERGMLDPLGIPTSEMCTMDLESASSMVGTPRARGVRRPSKVVARWGALVKSTFVFPSAVPAAAQVFGHDHACTRFCLVRSKGWIVVRDSPDVLSEGCLSGEVGQNAANERRRAPRGVRRR